MYTYIYVYIYLCMYRYIYDITRLCGRKAGAANLAGAVGGYDLRPDSRRAVSIRFNTEHGKLSRENLVLDATSSKGRGFRLRLLLLLLYYSRA